MKHFMWQEWALSKLGYYCSGDCDEVNFLLCTFIMSVVCKTSTSWPSLYESNIVETLLLICNTILHLSLELYFSEGCSAP